MQRFQRIDGRHHGAAFEACGRGETRRPQAHQPSVRPGSQKRSRQNHFTQHHRPNVTHPLHLNTVLLSLNGSLTRCELLPAADASLPRRQSCKNHAGRQDNMTPNLKRLKKKHNTVLVPTNTEAAAHSGQTVPTAAQVQHVLSKAVHPLLVQPSHKSPEPFTITKRQTAARLRRLKPQCLLRPPAHSVSTPTFSKQAGTTCWLKSRRSLIQTEQLIPNAPLNVTCICVKHGLSG